MSEDVHTSREDLRDLLPLYALDSVDDFERRRVDRLLASDPAAQRTVDEFHEVVAAFSADIPPPAHVREQVLAALKTAPVNDLSPRRSPNQRVRRWRGLAVAAAVVIGIAVPTTVAVQSRMTQHQVQAEADRLSTMLADPDAKLLTAAIPDGGDVTVLVSGTDALLSATGLGALDDTQDYQLWQIADDAITSAGLLSPRDGAVSQQLRVEAGVTLAVTVEPRGGSEQPTTEPIVALET